MKIGIDAGCLGVTDEGLKVGVYTIVKHALIELAKLDTKNTYFLYSFYPVEQEVMKRFGKNFQNIVVRPTRGWMKIWLPMRLVLDKIDIFIGANQAVPLRFPFTRYKTIGIIYDIAFEKYPELYAYAASVGKHRYYSQQTAEKSDTIIAISQKTKDDLVEVYKTPAQKITVVYPGIVLLSTVKPYVPKNKYFLYVGAFKKGKNIPTLLQAYQEFRKTNRQKAGLIMVGGKNWLDPDITEVLEKMPEDIRSDIHMVGAITDSKKLSALYRGAVAFVCPSLYEGFGLPFVEAMSVGCPVIGSNRGSIPEIVGNAGILKDAYDVEGLAKAMVKLATDKKLRNSLAEKGSIQSKRYSFKSFAKAIYSAIERLA